MENKNFSQNWPVSIEQIHFQNVKLRSTMVHEKTASTRGARVGNLDVIPDIFVKINIHDDTKVKLDKACPIGNSSENAVYTDLNQ